MFMGALPGRLMQFSPAKASKLLVFRELQKGTFYILEANVDKTGWNNRSWNPRFDDHSCESKSKKDIRDLDFGYLLNLL